MFKARCFAGVRKKAIISRTGNFRWFEVFAAKAFFGRDKRQ